MVAKSQSNISSCCFLFFQYLLLFPLSTCLVTIDLFLSHYFNIKSRDPFVLDDGSSLHLSRRRELHRRTRGRKGARASTVVIHRRRKGTCLIFPRNKLSRTVTEEHRFPYLDVNSNIYINRKISFYKYLVFHGVMKVY
ncbi:hypothetical protein NC651_030208 [Populus alba x Populus x berolinensis]|nr:hypothetical protein NC651_030208 [Populus alba x Populus x berolinensis]